MPRAKREPGERSRHPLPDAVVLFGVTGDLAHQMVFPVAAETTDVTPPPCLCVSVPTPATRSPLSGTCSICGVALVTKDHPR